MSEAAARVAVIVPGLNAAATLPRCIAAIDALASAPDARLFVDDGSQDDSGAIAARGGFAVITNPGPPLGPGLARNRAAAAAEDCALLLFVDADVAIAPAALGRLRAALDDGCVAAFGSYDDAPPAPGVASRYANLRHHFVHQQGAGEATTFWAGIGLVRRDAFLAAGGFSPAYGRPSIEDIELGARLVAAGGRIRLVPDAQGAHLKHWTLRQLWRTDVLQRAIPWSRLIAAGDSSAAGLNASGGEKAAAVWAWLLAVLLVAGLAWPPAWWGALVAAAGYGVQNRRFFGFLRRQLPPFAWIGAMALHWCYHLYASAILGVALVAARRRR